MTFSEHKKLVILGDTHIPFHDVKILNLIYSFCEWFKPDMIVHGGDLMDMYSLSKFSKEPSPPDMLNNEFSYARKVLTTLKKLAPIVHFIEGNHEARLKKFLNDAAPALRGLMREETGKEILSLDSLLELDKLEITHTEMIGREAYKKYNQILIGHFNKVSKHSAYTAKALVEDKGISVLQHHTHRGGVYYKTTINGQLMGIENFCTCNIHPEYILNPNWQQGFTVVMLDKNGKRFTAYPICIVDYKFLYGDKKFEL